MLGSLLRRNMSQRLSVVLLVLGLAWGLTLMRYTLQPQRQTSAELRQQILELSHRYVRVLSEENQQGPAPQGTSMAGYADLKRTIAVLLDDILQRLVKLEGKVDAAVNGSLTNATHTTSGGPAPPPPQRRPRPRPAPQRRPRPRPTPPRAPPA
ncbi:hypothetical protein AAFF_G00307590 [Aldrovandia affinis]|uniref:MGT5A-like N-terminal domain-containing protein n=1 Tax=Aldrovandia affinis TaxID=143900 RepID=A0AAD7W0N0_9TELE|nr:hypothetical protein AAFF_G00307590 [Aldrovandia affinis]